MQVIEFYQKQLPSLNKTLSEAKKKVQVLTFLRLLIFLAIVSFTYFFWGNSLIVSLSLAVGIALFLIAVSFSVDAKLALEKVKQKIKLIQLEITQIETNQGQFDPGAVFQDPKHAFSYDLDLFTPKGIFAFINRTTSKLGRELLAKNLLYPSLNEEKRKQQQDLIEALSKEMEWMQDFRVSASISSREDAFDKSLAGFGKLEFKNASFVKIAAVLIPIVSISALILNYFNLVPGSISGLIITLSLLPTTRLLKETNMWSNAVSGYQSKIKIVMDQLILLKSLDIDGLGKAHLTDIEQELKTWVKISRRFDLRLNIVVGIPLNIFFAWDIQQRLALEKWSNKNKTKLQEWEHELAQIEVLISAATLRFNHASETIYPNFTNSNSYNCIALAHPMIPVLKRVTNDFILSSEQHFVILTGPNMAGKSTFLRSLGMNIVFANAGFPVFAEHFEIPELNLFSSMRTSDDLSQESSYFHAELTRLKFIQENMQTDKQSFVLLDEILKGTNSKDKEEGSKKFLQKMKRIGAKGIIATHDLSLCVLSNEDTAFVNFYFDSTISNNELSFDYKMKNGICQNMNASFLLQKMNLVD
ncbi:MAG: MutS-related protein [Flavobacteriia bacterium]|jgi:hypothetical protein